MGKIYFDTEELEVLSSELDTISSNLNDIMDQIKNFDVPNVWFDWFSQRKFLDDSYADNSSSNLYRSVRNCKTQCDSVRELVNDCKDNLNLFSSEMEQSFSKIEDVDLKPRGSIVILK